MFFFIPYSTDANIYYWPFATGALILINIMAFVAQMAVHDQGGFEFDEMEQVEFEFEEDDPDLEELKEQAFELFFRKPGWYKFALSHGDGLHPVQWITSMFMHANFMHLLGNMIFLWAFGLPLEGRMGPFGFVSLYVGTGFIQNIIEQLLFLGADSGYSLGASSAIYAIMMVCMLWMPQDNLLGFFFGWVFFRVFFLQLHIPLAMIAAIYFLWDFGAALFSEFAMSTPLLHIMGGFVGLFAGFMVLQLRWVDCEDRDMVSLLREAITGNARPKNYKPPKKSKREVKEEAEAKLELDRKIELTYRSIDQHLLAGRHQTAIRSFRELKRLKPSAEWPQNTLLKLLNLLQTEKRWDEVVTYSLMYIKLYEPQRDTVRLNLARIYVTQKMSPKKAINILKQIDQTSINDKQKAIMRQIIAKSKEMIADGVIEVSDD